MVSGKVRKLESGKFLCEGDNTEFTELRFAERHARLLMGRRDPAQENDDGSGAATAIEDEKVGIEADGGFELSLYASLSEEKNRCAVAEQKGASPKTLPDLSPIPSEPVAERIESVRNDQVLPSATSKGLTTDGLLKELVRKSKEGKRRAIAKRHARLSRHDERLSALLGSVYKTILPITKEN